MRKNNQPSLIFAILIGNILEWYCFSIFIQLLPFFSHTIFSQLNSQHYILLATLLFMASFILRLIGGIFFAFYADRYSRIDSLVASVAIMLITAIFMACLPLNSSCLLFSAIFMIIFRAIQGLATGGEFAVSIVYAVEQAPTLLRGLYGSLPVVGGFMGILLAHLVFQLMNTYLTTLQLISFGWRLAFLLGVPLGILGYFIRRHIRESSTFIRYQEHHKPLRNPLVASFKNYKMILLTCLASALIFTAIHGMILNMSHYLREMLHHQLTFKLNIIDYTLSLIIVLCPIAALLSDLIGRKIVYIAGCLGLILTAGPIFILISHYDQWQSIVAETLLAIFIASLCGSMPTILAESFPTATRATSLAISLNLSAVIFGAIAAYASIWCYELFSSFIAVATYILVVAVISLTAILYLPEVSKHSPITKHSE